MLRGITQDYLRRTISAKKSSLLRLELTPLSKFSLMDLSEHLKRLELNCNSYINACINSDRERQGNRLLKDVNEIISLSDTSNAQGQYFHRLEPQLRSLSCNSSYSEQLSRYQWSHFLLIGGVGRSGTTALGNCLNTFFGNGSRFFTFTERYRWTLPYSPASFLDEFAFAKDKRVSQSAITSKYGKYQENPLSYSRLHVVGDKRPGSAYLLHASSLFFAKFNKNLVYLHLFRDPLSTALSWDARSKDPNDRWPASWNAEMMAKHFCSQSKIALSLQRKTPLENVEILLINYDKFFFDSVYCALTLSDIAHRCGLRAYINRAKIHEFACQFVDSNHRYRASRDSKNKDALKNQISRNGFMGKALEIYDSMVHF